MDKEKYLDEIESLQVTVVGMREEMTLARAALRNMEVENNGLRALRPVWAQGWTSDSGAAQASGAALAQIWEFLGVSNQTDAIQKLKAMK